MSSKNLAPTLRAKIFEICTEGSSQCEALQPLLYEANPLYGNVIPNDIWVFLGEGAKWEGLPWCKVSNDCGVVSDNPAGFVEPPDQDVYCARFFLSVAGDFAVNPSVRRILTGA
jgi:hypothetical protein